VLFSNFLTLNLNTVNIEALKIFVLSVISEKDPLTENKKSDQ